MILAMKGLKALTLAAFFFPCSAHQRSFVHSLPVYIAIALDASQHHGIDLSHLATSFVPERHFSESMMKKLQSRGSHRLKKKILKKTQAHSNESTTLLKVAKLILCH